MAESNAVVNCLLIQVSGNSLILPQSSIAEVVRIPDVLAKSSSVDWFKGIFEWRRQQVPLISFDRLCGWDSVEPKGNVRWAAILYALTQAHGLVFYALEIHTTPRSLGITADSICEDTSVNSQADHDVVAAHVLVNDQVAIIPNIPRIESLLHEQLS